jgi:hypothetical protein
MNQRNIRTPKGCEFIGLRSMNVWNVHTMKGANSR